MSFADTVCITAVTPYTSHTSHLQHTQLVKMRLVLEGKVPQGKLVVTKELCTLTVV